MRHRLCPQGLYLSFLFCVTDLKVQSWMLVPRVVTFWLNYYALHRVHRSWGRGQCIGVERWSVRPVICPALRIKVGGIGRRHVLVFGRASRFSCWFEIQPWDKTVRTNGDAAVGPLPDIVQSRLILLLVRRQFCRHWRSRAGRDSDVLADRRLFEDETGRGCRHFVVLMWREIWRLHCTLVTELDKNKSITRSFMFLKF